MTFPNFKVMWYMFAPYMASDLKAPQFLGGGGGGIVLYTSTDKVNYKQCTLLLSSSRPKQSYRPAEEESRVDELRPMGNLVFDLPLSPVNSAFNSTYATSLDEPYSKSQDGGFDHQQMLTAGTLSMDVCLSGSQSGSRDDLGAVGVSAAGNMDDELDQGKGAFRSWNGSMNQINAVVESHTCSMDGGLHRTRRHESVDGGVDEIRSVSRDSGLADEMPVDGRSKYNSSIVLPNCDTYT